LYVSCSAWRTCHTLRTFACERTCAMSGGRICSSCQQMRSRAEYSSNQLKKNIGSSVCTHCVNAQWQGPAAATKPIPGSEGMDSNTSSLLQMLAMQELAVSGGLSANLAFAAIDPCASSVRAPGLAIGEPATKRTRTEPVVASKLASLPGLTPFNPSPVDPPDLTALGLPLPSVVIFDLDDTCWRQGLDRKGAKGAPYRWDDRLGLVVDQAGAPVRVLPELPAVLLSLHRAGVQIAVASHNSKPAWCAEVMDKWILDKSTGLTWGELVPEELRIINWQGKFYPTKNEHIKTICGKLPAGPCSPPESIIFDDSKQAITGATAMGVTAVRVMDGMTVQLLLEGLKTCAIKLSRIRGASVGGASL